MLRLLISRGVYPTGETSWDTTLCKHGLVRLLRIPKIAAMSATRVEITTFLSKWNQRLSAAASIADVPEIPPTSALPSELSTPTDYLHIDTKTAELFPHSLTVEEGNSILPTSRAAWAMLSGLLELVCPKSSSDDNNGADNDNNNHAHIPINSNLKWLYEYFCEMYELKPETAGTGLLKSQNPNNLYYLSKYLQCSDPHIVYLRLVLLLVSLD